VETGIKIIEGMRGHTSGLAIPAFVIDLPQGGGKVPLQPDYLLAQTEDELVLRNYQGHTFRYRNPVTLKSAEPTNEELCPAKNATASPPREALPVRVRRSSKCG
jgi:hypothetical protein